MGEVALTPEGHKMSFIVTMASTIAQELGVSPQAVTSTGVIILIGLHAMAAIPLYRWCFPGAGGPGMARAATVTFLIVAYSVCSSMLLILNKVAVTYIPAPSFILFCQLASCAVFVKAMSLARLVECEPLEYEKSKKFALIVFGFIGTLFANVTALKYVPVDTIICFRASTPIVIAVIEYFYLGRELPSLRSWGSLFGVFVGVAIYTAADIHFTVLGYAWIVIWYTFAVFEMVWVKKVVDSIQQSTWSRTFYQNTLAVPPMLLVSLVTGELSLVFNQSWGPMAWVATAMSCVAGLGMSYFSFALRAAISATSFSVIGNVCKVLTILVNLLMWDNHANVYGTAALFFCLFMGTFYQQPAMRKEHRAPSKDDESLLPRSGEE